MGVVRIYDILLDYNDVLMATDRFSPTRKGTVLIEAMRDAAVDIEEK